jgi:hypothetical protein
MRSHISDEGWDCVLEKRNISGTVFPSVSTNRFACHLHLLHRRNQFFMTFTKLALWIWCPGLDPWEKDFFFGIMVLVNAVHVSRAGEG